MRSFTIFYFLFATCVICKAQTSVKVDLQSAANLIEVPFDEYFNLDGQLQDLTSVTLNYSDPNSIGKLRKKGEVINKDIPGIVNTAAGTFSIPFRYFLPPSKEELYSFKITYKCKLAESVSSTIRANFKINIQEFIKDNIKNINKTDFVDSDATKKLIRAILGQIPHSDNEHISVTPNGLLDENASHLPVNKHFVADLFTAVKQQESSIIEIRAAIGQDAATTGLKPNLLQLFTEARFNSLKSSKNKEINAFAKIVAQNPTEAVEVLATGGSLNVDSPSTDAGFVGFEGTDGALLGKKALNYFHYDELFTAIKNEFQAKKDKTGENEADRIEREFRLLPKRSIEIQKQIEKVQNLINQLTTSINLALVDQVEVTGTGSGDFLVRAGRYISLDVGALYAPAIDELLPYIGANFYFRAIKKSTSFVDLRREYNSTFWHRFAAVIGFTPTTINRNDQINTGVLLNRALLLGVGYRATEYLRLGGGLLFVKQDDTNPLITNYKLVTTPHLSISIDLQVFNQYSSNFK